MAKQYQIKSIQYIKLIQGQVQETTNGNTQVNQIVEHVKEMYQGRIRQTR